jgi:hypothetical protein
MLFFFQKYHNFFHGLMELIWRRGGGGNEGHAGVLDMAMRRITINDNPTASGACPIFNLQAL